MQEYSKWEIKVCRKASSEGKITLISDNKREMREDKTNWFCHQWNVCKKWTTVGTEIWAPDKKCCTQEATKILLDNKVALNSQDLEGCGLRVTPKRWKGLPGTSCFLQTLPQGKGVLKEGEQSFLSNVRKRNLQIYSRERPCMDRTCRHFALKAQHKALCTENEQALWEKQHRKPSPQTESTPPHLFR